MNAQPHELPVDAPGCTPIAEALRSRVPALETARLRLRSPVLEDFDAYARIATGPAGRFLSDDPTRENAWYDFTGMVSLWMLRGFGLWSVESRADRELAGFVVLGFEPGDHEPELGFMFLPAFEGRGYAAEAALAAREFAFETLGFPSLVSTIDHGNDRSIRLAERMGASRDPEAEAAHGHAIRVYRHNRDREEA